MALNPWDFCPGLLRKEENIILEFYYSMYNQHESFIYLDLIIKNRKIPIERYFK
jgi:hypothetical protein